MRNGGVWICPRCSAKESGARFLLGPYYVLPFLTGALIALGVGYVWAAVDYGAWRTPAAEVRK